MSRLQQEILALSNADARDASTAQLAQLERELDKTQQELAKYQGRI